MNEYKTLNDTIENIERFIKDVQNQNTFIRPLAINPRSTSAECVEFKKDKAISKKREKIMQNSFIQKLVKQYGK